MSRIDWEGLEKKDKGPDHETEEPNKPNWGKKDKDSRLKSFKTRIFKDNKSRFGRLSIQLVRLLVKKVVFTKKVCNIGCFSIRF